MLSDKSRCARLLRVIQSSKLAAEARVASGSASCRDAVFRVDVSMRMLETGVGHGGSISGPIWAYGIAQFDKQDALNEISNALSDRRRAMHQLEILLQQQALIAQRLARRLDVIDLLERYSWQQNR